MKLFSLEHWVMKIGSKRLRKFAGSDAPLYATLIIGAAFLLEVFGAVGLSEFALRFYGYVGVESAVSIDDLRALRGLIETIVAGLITLGAPVAGAGAVSKSIRKHDDARGKLDKPPVISRDLHNEMISSQDASEYKALRFNTRWRELMNGDDPYHPDGMSAIEAARLARSEVFKQQLPN